MLCPLELPPPGPTPMAAQQRALGGAGGVSLESTEILSPTSPSKPAPPMAAMVMLPPPAVAAPSRSRASLREKDAAQGMKYEGVIDWLHYAPGPRLEQSRFTSVSVGDMYWRIVSPIRTQELVRARTWASARREEGAGVAGRGAASRRACAHARTCACAHPRTDPPTRSPRPWRRPCTVTLRTFSRSTGHSHTSARRARLG